MNLLDLFVTVRADTAQAQTALKAVTAQGVAAERSMSSSMQRIGSSMQSVGTSFTRVGGSMSTFVSGPLALAGAGMVKLASDAEETGSKFRVVFGKDAPAMNKWITSLQKIMPATRAEIQEMSASMQLMLEGMGIAPSRAQDMSKQLVTLSGDLASFNNIPVAEAQDAITGALRGEYDMLQRFVPAVSAAKVEQQAMKMGLGDTTEQISAQDKALAIFELTMNSTKDAQGDMARTADSTANSFKFLWRDVKEAATTFGKDLLPVITPVVQKLTDLVSGFGKLSPTMRAVILGVGVFAAALGPLVMAMGLLLVSGGAIIGALAGLGGVLGTLAAFAAPVTAAILGLAAAGVLIYRNWDKVAPAFAKVRDIFGTVATQVRGFLQVINNVARGTDNFGGAAQKLSPALIPVAIAIGKAVAAAKNLFTVFKGLVTGNSGAPAVRQAFAALPGPLQNLVVAALNLWRTFKTQVLPILQQVARGIKTGVVTAFNFLVEQGKKLVSFFRSQWPQIKSTALAVFQAVAAVIKTVAGAAFEFLISQAKVVVNWFKKNWPLIKETAMTVFNAVKTVVTAVLRVVWSVIKATVEAIVRFWRANHTEIMNVVEGAWKIIKTVVSTAIKAVLGIIKAIMQAITGDWKGAWETIKGVLKTVWEGIKTIVDAAIKIVKNVIKVAWEWVKMVTSAAWDAIKSVLKTVWDGIKSLVKAALDALRENLKAAWDAIKATTSTVWNAIKSFLKTLWDGIKSLVKAALDALRSNLKAAWEAIKSATSSAWEAIKNFIQDKFEAARDRVGAIVQDLKRGLSGAWDAIKSNTSSAWEAVKDFMQDKFEAARKRVGEIVQDLKSGLSGAWEAIKKAASDAWEAISGAIWRPIQTAFEKVKGFLEGVIGVVNAVLKAFGLSPVNVNFGSSGTGGGGNAPDTSGSGTGINPPSGTVPQFAKGGRVRARRGGVYQVAEGGDDEWVINPSRPDNVKHLRDAAREMGYGIRPERRHRHGSGSTPPRKERDHQMPHPPGYGGLDFAGQAGGPVQNEWDIVNEATRSATINAGLTRYGDAYRRAISLWNQGPISVKAGNGWRVRDTYAPERSAPAWSGILGVMNNTAHMDNYTTAQRYSVSTHEVGHGMGLDHGVPPPSIMSYSSMYNVGGRPQPNDWAALNARYGSSGGSGPGGVSGVPSDYQLPPLRGPGATRNWNATTLAIVRAITHAVPGTNPNTYAGHPGGEQWSSDWWGMGGRGAPIPSGLGDQVASQIAKTNGWRWYIWKGMLHNAGGSTQPYNGTFAGHPDRHFDHIHGTWGAGAGVGGSGPSLADRIWLGEGAGPGGDWKSRLAGFVANVVNYPGLDKILKPFDVPGDNVMSAALTQYVGQGYKDWVHDWIYSKFGGTGGGSSGGGNFSGQGGTPAQNQVLGKKMLASSGVPGSWDSLDRLWTRESGWNQYADNPDSPAYGIPQSNPGSKMGPEANPPKSDPAAQIDWGLNYIRGRYGSTDAAWGHSQNTGWYGEGGIALGPHLGIVGEGGSPEMMMPLPGTPYKPAMDSLGLSGLAEQLDALTARVDHQTDVLTRLGVPVANPEAISDVAHAAQESRWGQAIQARNSARRMGQMLERRR